MPQMACARSCKVDFPHHRRANHLVTGEGLLGRPICLALVIDAAKIKSARDPKSPIKNYIRAENISLRGGAQLIKKKTRMTTRERHTASL